ncbi:MAG: ribonuclease HII [Fibrobacter sp.]|nr:ribonuclease HII [Fibrobacter sp.]
MKFKPPAFLENIESPVEGEVALRKYAANPLSFGGDGSLDLFAGNSADATGNRTAIVIGIDEVGRGPLAGPVVACAAVLKSPDALLTLNDSKKLSRPKREAMFEQVKDACACYAIASASVEEIDEMNILEADFLAMRRALQALGFPGLNETAPEIPIDAKGSLNNVIQNNAANNVILNGAQRNEGSSDSSSNVVMPDPAARHPGLVPGSPFSANILIAVDGNLKIHGVPAEKQMPIVKGDGRIASISAASILAKVFRDRYMDKLEELYPGYGFDKHAGYGTKAHLDAIRRQGYTPAHRKSFHPKGL